MVAKRHDWLKYKEDYFDSPIDSVKDFFESFVIPVPKSSYKARAQGWREEKEAFKRKQLEVAREKKVNNPEIQDMNAALIMGKANALKIVMTKLIKEKDKLGMRDLKDGIDIIRRELGEPLTISENKNKNENEFSLGEDFKRLLSGYVGFKQIEEKS
jgi:hypothetical protein